MTPVEGGSTGSMGVTPLAVADAGTVLQGEGGMREMGKGQEEREGRGSGG